MQIDIILLPLVEVDQSSFYRAYNSLPMIVTQRYELCPEICCMNISGYIDISWAWWLVAADNGEERVRNTAIMIRS